MNLQSNNTYRYPRGRLATTNITNDLAEAIDRLQPLQPGGGAGDNGPRIYRPVWLVKPGEPVEDRAGVFSAKLIDESTLKNIDTGDLEESTLGTMPDEDNCEVWDISTLPGIHAGVTVGVNKDGQPIVVVNRASPVMRLAVTAIENDYLECKAIDEDGNPTGDVIRVAKPWELRHDAKFYQGVNSISTVTAQSIDATDSSITERWEVRPPYLLGGGSPAKDRTIILAASIDKTGVTYEDEEEEEHEITMIDINVAGRVWGLKYT